jgi:hypothetical protein
MTLGESVGSVKALAHRFDSMSKTNQILTALPVLFIGFLLFASVIGHRDDGRAMAEAKMARHAAYVAACAPLKAKWAKTREGYDGLYATLDEEQNAEIAYKTCIVGERVAPIIAGEIRIAGR